MKMFLIIFVCFIIHANVFAIVNEPFTDTLQIENMESQINLTTNEKGIEISFGYSQKSRNITIRAKNASELLNKLKTERPKEYSIKEMEELCSWIDMQLASGQVKSLRFNTLNTDNLKGRIKSIETARFTMDQAKNELIQDTSSVVRSIFNEDGNLVKDEIYNTQNVLKYGRLFDYHPNGLVKQITYINNKKEVTYREVFELDEKGNYSGGQTYQENDKLHRTFTILNQNEYGQWTRMNWYSLDGSLYAEDEATYEGNRKVHELNRKNGEIEMDFRTTYDANGEKRTEDGKHPYYGTVSIRTYSRIDALDV